MSMHIDIAVAGPNPGCPRYFGRDGQRGKDALRELQAGLRKFALLTCTGPPPSASASTPTTPTYTPSSPSAASSTASIPPGLCLNLLQEVTRYIPHGFTTRAVAKHLVLPLALSNRTALCDIPGLLYRKQVTPAMVHVVHAWDAPFHDLSTLLQEYTAQTANPALDSIYIDVLCANLYSSVTSSHRIKDVKAQLKAAPSILIVLSSTGSLNRTWVLYQIWLVAREHRMGSTMLRLSPPLNKEMVRTAAKNISLRHSMAAQEDKDAILADVLRSHTASATFDTEVYQVLLRKLMEPDEELAYEQQLQQQEAERQAQIQDHMEQLNLTSELRAFQAEAVAPRLFRDDPPRSAPKPGAVEEAEAATASTPAGFDPSAFMAGFLGIAKSASKMMEEEAGRADDEEVAPSAGGGAGGAPAAFMAGLPPMVEEPEPEAAAAFNAEAAAAAASAAGAVLPGSAVQLLSRLYKAVYFNHDRLIGMVGQFDAEDKGFLSTAELEDFITFFIDNCEDADAKALADAVSSSAEGKVDADNMVPILKAMQEGAKASPATPPPAAPTPASAFSKQESMNRLASLAASRATTPLLAPTLEAAEAAAPAPSSTLTGSVSGLLNRLYKAVYFNHDRLIGMVGQFDGEDKGFLSVVEMEDFITFFIDNCADADAKALAAAVSSAAEGKVDADNMVPILKALQEGAKASPAAPPAAPPPAAPSAIPTFGKQQSGNSLASLAASRLGTPQTPHTPTTTDAVAAAASTAPEGPIPSSSKQVLGKLFKAVYHNQDRLVGMVGHFDGDDKGFLTAAELGEFIVFYVENSSPEDAALLASSMFSAAGGQVDADNMIRVLKEMHGSAAAKRKAEAEAPPQEPEGSPRVAEAVAEEEARPEAEAEAEAAEEAASPAAEAEAEAAAEAASPEAEPAAAEEADKAEAEATGEAASPEAEATDEAATAGAEAEAEAAQEAASSEAEANAEAAEEAASPEAEATEEAASPEAEAEAEAAAEAASAEAEANAEAAQEAASPEAEATEEAASPEAEAEAEAAEDTAAAPEVLSEDAPAADEAGTTAGEEVAATTASDASAADVAEGEEVPAAAEDAAADSEEAAVDGAAAQEAEAE